MKKSIFSPVLLVLLLMATSVKAQMGIGTATPNAAAQLDVTSTTKGFLVPRMTKTERDHAFNNFKKGGSRVLISSNITARGIDIQQVSVVINFDLPSKKKKVLCSIGYYFVLCPSGCHTVVLLGRILINGIFNCLHHSIRFDFEHHLACQQCRSLVGQSSLR